MNTFDQRLDSMTQAVVVPEPRGRLHAAGPTRGDTPPPESVLYGCFSCPWCYLASQRTSLLPDLSRRPLWRMIAPQPPPPAAGRPLDRSARQRLEVELASINDILLPGEMLPARVPTFKPNTGPAVVGYAEAVGAGVGGPVRELLFDAYWQRGADIGNPEVLRQLLADPIRAGHSASWPLRDFGYAVSLSGGPITNDAYYRIRDWRADWHTAEGTTFPTLIDPDITSTGDAVLAILRDKIRFSPTLYSSNSEAETLRLA